MDQVWDVLHANNPKESIAQFIAITGCDNMETVNNYLEFGGGDIEMAVQLFLESEGSRNLESTRNHMNERSTIESEVRAPIAPKREMLASSTLSYSGPFDIHRHDRAVGSIRSAIRTNQFVFAPPEDLIFPGSFEMAQKEALERKSWIMVTIHDESDFSCVQFNRDIWRDKSVKETVRDHFIFLFYESNSNEAQEHLNYYSFLNYPYVAILDPLTKERVKYWNTLMTPDDFLMEVSEFLVAKTNTGDVMEKKKKGKDITMLSEEQQLELALKASLGNNSMLDLANDMDEDDVVEIFPEISKDPKTVFNDIPYLSSYSPTTNDTTRLQIKFPSGKRVVQAFDKSSPISTVFGFIKGVHSDEVTGPFDLFNIRDPLLSRANETLQAVGVLSSALTLDYII